MKLLMGIALLGYLYLSVLPQYREKQDKDLEYVLRTYSLEDCLDFLDKTGRFELKAKIEQRVLKKYKAEHKKSALEELDMNLKDIANSLK